MIRSFTKNCIASAGSFVSLSWLTGPIFDKELRVTSRRFRYYVLRSGYLAVLALLLAMVWASEVHYSPSSISQASRMARAGQTIISSIVWFQFCAVQLIALVSLSSAISDEIYHKTLGVLMTTPINSFQIVMGKLGSHLLQLILLMGISLPVLAIVRIFGGVRWDYLISSLCITLTTVLFVAAVCLFYSIFNKRFYVVITSTVLSFGILFAMIPLLTLMIWHTLDPIRARAAARIVSGIALFNPYLAMGVNTLEMIQPGAAGRVTFSWPLHCAIMLVASALVVTASVILVRRAALHQAIGATTNGNNRPRRVRPFAAFAFLTVTLLLVAAQLLFESFWSVSRYSSAGWTSRGQGHMLVSFIFLQFCLLQFLAVLLPFLRYRNARADSSASGSNSQQNISGRCTGFIVFDTFARLLLIAAIALPFFAMLRRMAEIPWDRIVPCLCATIATAFFTAALTMLLLTAVTSIWRRIIVIGILFTTIPLLVCLLTFEATLHAFAAKAIFYTNPYTLFALHCARLVVPDSLNTSVLLPWYFHCIITVGQAALLMLAAIVLAARRCRSAVPAVEADLESESSQMQQSAIRRVTDKPVFWKELRVPMIKKGKTAAIVAGAIAIFALFLTYDLCAAERQLDDDDMQAFYVIVFTCLGFLGTITLPATCITTEKEARTWPILLATSLGDYQIIFGKLAAQIRRFLPMWSLLFAHLVLFSLFRYIHPIAIIHYAIIITGAIIFLTCTGIYFSNRYRRTATAVVAHFAFVSVIWLLLPSFIYLAAHSPVFRIKDNPGRYAEDYLMMTTPGQMIVVGDATLGDNRARRPINELSWFWGGNDMDDVRVGMATAHITANAFLHVMLGIFFLWRTKQTMRRNIF